MGSRSELAADAGIAAARAACRLFAPLPIEGLRRLGVHAGDALLRHNGRGVRTTRTNVDLVYSRRDVAWRRRLVRDSVRHTAMLAAEGIALWTWPLPKLERLVQDVQGERLLRDRPAGRGALFLAPHFGNWEFLGYYLNTLEPLAPLYEQPKSAALDRALGRARRRLGHRPAPGSLGGLRQLVKVLRDGGMVAVLPDQVPAKGAGVTVPFFGREAYTVALVGKLLAHSDADVVIGSARRVGGGFAVCIEAVDAAIRAADPRRSARALNQAVEAVVARDPAQYQWEYKRFRFPGQPNVYR